MGAHSDADLAASIDLAVEADGRLRLETAAALAGCDTRTIRTRRHRLAALVSPEARAALEAWPHAGTPDRDLVAAVVLLVTEEQRFAPTPCALLAGCSLDYLLRRLPHLDLPPAVRLVVQNCRPFTHQKVRCQDEDLACAASLVIEAEGWCNLQRVGQLAGLHWHTVRQRLPAVLWRLSLDERQAVLTRLGEEEEGDFEGPAPLPETATDAPAGSPEKIAVLIARAAAGVQLHHPGDSRRLLQVSDRGVGQDQGEVSRSPGRTRVPRPRRDHVPGQVSRTPTGPLGRQVEMSRGGGRV